MSTDIALAGAHDMGGLVRFAEYVDKDPFGVVAKMGVAQAYGFHPALFNDVVYIMEQRGKKTFGVSSKAVGALIQKHPKYDYTIVKQEANECTIKFAKRSDITGEVETWEKSMTLDYAKRAGWTKTNSWNWDKYPAQMLFYRTLTEGARAFCPEVLGGGNAYSVDEMPGAEIVEGAYTDIVEVEGTEVEVKAVPAPEREVVVAQPVADEYTIKAVNWVNRYLNDEVIVDEDKAVTMLAKALARIADYRGMTVEDATAKIDYNELYNDDRARFLVALYEGKEADFKPNPTTIIDADDF